MTRAATRARRAISRITRGNFRLVRDRHGQRLQPQGELEARAVGATDRPVAKC